MRELSLFQRQLLELLFGQREHCLHFKMKVISGNYSVLWITTIKDQWRQDQTKTCIPDIWLDFVRMKDHMWHSRDVAEETVA